jgi:CheY-like chemotaxis protein
MQERVLKEIHYVEDSDDEVFLSGLLLRKDGVDVKLVHHPALSSFLDMLEKTPIDQPLLAFFDLNMPRIKGTDAIREVRKIDRTNLVLGICTGSEDPADAKLALEAGADFFVNKPLSCDRLDSIVALVEGVGLRKRPDGKIELFHRVP